MILTHPFLRVGVLSVPSVHETVRALSEDLTGRRAWRGHGRVGVGGLCHPHGKSLLYQLVAVQLPSAACVA